MYKSTDIGEVFAYDNVLIGVSFVILIFFIGILMFFAKWIGKKSLDDEVRVESENLVEKQEIELT